MPTQLNLIDELERRNRAYQVLYALGSSPDTVGTLEPGEADILIEAARRVRDGDRSTETARKIAELSPVMLNYIVTGRLSA